MYLVTGPLGNVGREVVDILLARGAPVRAFVRPGHEASIPAGCEVAVGDLTNADDVLTAARGADGVFMLAGHAGLDAAVPALASRGVRRVVVLSTVAAASGDLTNAISAFHINTERTVLASDLAWTFVRSYALMSNVFRWTRQLTQGDTVRLPFADLPIAMVDPRDVAEVAAISLTEPGHERQAYPVSGPAAVLPAEQVAAVGHVLNRHLTMQPLGNDDARREMAATTPAEFVAATFRYYERGEIDETTVRDTVPRVTGHPAGTLHSYLTRPAVKDMLSASTSRPSARPDVAPQAAHDHVDNTTTP